MRAASRGNGVVRTAECDPGASERGYRIRLQCNKSRDEVTDVVADGNQPLSPPGAFAASFKRLSTLRQSIGAPSFDRRMRREIFSIVYQRGLRGTFADHYRYLCFPKRTSVPIAPLTLLE
jgi:hypothetical protein